MISFTTKITQYKPYLNKVWFSVFLLALSFGAQAQKKTDTSSKITINILFAKRFIGVKTDSLGGTMTRLIDSVSMEQNGTLMYCDSTYINMQTNNLEAFGDVRIIQPGGTQVTSDYLRYTGNTKLGYLKGNVKLTDGKNSLWSDSDLNYDMGTKIGTYEHGGTLQNEGTTVSSNKGMYNVTTKDSRFTQDVYITDPQYTCISDDLAYNTDRKFVTFLAPSVVTNKNSELRTSGGTYDSKGDVAHFTTRSSIYNKEHYIEGDKIDYNGLTRLGNAQGKVVIIDTIQHTKMWCGFAAYNEKRRTMLGLIKPVLRQANGKDSLYIRADTFFSAPLPPIKKTVKTEPGKHAKDSIARAFKENNASPMSDSARTKTVRITAVTDTAIKKTLSAADSIPKRDTTLTTDSIANKRKNSTAKDTVLKTKTDTVATAAPKKPVIDMSEFILPEQEMLTADTVAKATAARTKQAKNKKQKTSVTETISKPEPDADSTAPRYFIGYHHVLIYSDSLQGKCDSISYNQRDSVLRMMRDPILWSRKNQITGDTILLYNDSSRIKRLFVPNNALIVSQTGGEKVKMYDQVQGKTLTGYFLNNTIERMIVYPEAESIYYPKDDKGAYLGINEDKAERMRIFFKNQEIQKILFDQDPTHKITPFNQADISAMKLSRFKWLIELRPKTREALFK